MSRTRPPTMVLEWSPTGVRVFDSASRTVTEYRDASHAAGAVGGRAVVLAISRRSSFFRTMPLPNAARADLRRLLEFQGASLFPLPMADMAFDFQMTEETGPEGRTALVAAIPSTDLKRAFDEVRAAGFSITKVVPTAMGSALLAHEMGLTDAIVVESTHEGLALDAVVRGELRAARVASASSPEEEARRTAAMVGVEDVPVVASPGVEVGDGALRAVQSPLGSLIGPSSARITLDLEPRDILEKRDRATRTLRRRVAAVLAIAAVAVTIMAYLDHSAAQNSVTRQTASLTASVNHLKSLRKSAEADATRATKNKQVLDLAFSPAQPLPDAVAVVVNEVPAGVWLTGITVERGKPMLIRGTATHSQAVADFLARLGKNERLRDVRLVFSNNGTINVTQVVQFSISAFPIGNIPLAEGSTRRRT